MPLHFYYVGLLTSLLAIPIAAAQASTLPRVTVAGPTVAGLSLVIYRTFGAPGLRELLPSTALVTSYRSANCAELMIASAVPLLAIATTERASCGFRFHWTQIPVAVCGTTFALASSDLLEITHTTVSSARGLIIVPLGGLRMTAAVFVATWHSIATAIGVLLSSLALALAGIKARDRTVSLGGALSAALLFCSFVTRDYL